MHPSIQLTNGARFHLLDMSQNAPVPINTIAHSLSNICRFTGHCRETYSVAQHSYLLSQRVPKDQALSGLLHDVGEIVYGDVSSPLKQLLPDLKAIMRPIDQFFYDQFRIAMTAEIKAADIRMLATEARDLMPVDPIPWEILEGVEPYDMVITAWQPKMAERAFLTRYEALTA